MGKALLIIDMQNDYFPGGKMALEGPEEAVKNTKLILDRFRKEVWPVFHIRHVAMRPEATYFFPGTAGAHIHPAVKPLKDEKVFSKHFPNAFRDTNLLNALRKIDTQDLVICGMMTHICVDATTRAAKDLGFNCTVISDGCATRDLEVKKRIISAECVQLSFLGALQYFYAEVLTAAEFLEKLDK